MPQYRRRSADRRRDSAARPSGGGYILSTDHSIHDGMPFENVMAYIEAGKKYGVYGES